MYGKKAGYKTVGSIFMLNIQREFHVVQWLGLGTLTARAQVQSQVEALITCKLCGMKKKST